MAFPICDCCGGEATGVVLSCLGAVSWAFCNTCLQNKTEPEVMFVHTAWSTNGQAAEWVQQLTTFKDGVYIGWKDWFDKYGAEAIEKSNKQMDEYEQQEQTNG